MRFFYRKHFTCSSFPSIYRYQMYHYLPCVTLGKKKLSHFNKMSNRSFKHSSSSNLTWSCSLCREDCLLKPRVICQGNKLSKRNLCCHLAKCYVGPLDSWHANLHISLSWKMLLADNMLTMWHFLLHTILLKQLSLSEAACLTRKAQHVEACFASFFLLCSFKFGRLCHFAMNTFKNEILPQL